MGGVGCLHYQPVITNLRHTLPLEVYSIIGLGQVLALLVPLWPIKIKKSGSRRLHFWIVLLGALAVIAYDLFPDIRMGVDLLSGYFVWAISFLLFLVASVWMLFLRGHQNENQPVTSEA